MSHEARVGPLLPPTILLLMLLSIGIGRAQDPLPSDLSAIRVTSSTRPELKVQPGEVLTHQVTLENTGQAPSLVDVSKVDFRLDMNGDVVFEQAGTLETSNAAWTEVASQVEVPPMSTYSLPVAIKVPTDVAAGSYWSLLFVEPVEAISTARQEGEGGVSASVTVNYRFGVTLITHVGEPAERVLLFHDPAVVRDEDSGTSSISVTIENTTRFIVAGEAWLELYDQQGSLVQQNARTAFRSYPGARIRETFDLGALEGETYQAVIIADAGSDDVFGVRYDLDLGSD